MLSQADFHPVVGPLPEYGIKAILLGEISSGKTHALRTLWEWGLECFVISTEPGIEEVLGDLPPESFHWHYCPPSATSFDDMIESATKINNLDYEALTKLKGVNKNKHKEFIELLNTLRNFKCDRTGKEYGPVDGDYFDSSKALVLDSLSGASIMSMDLTVGSKPVKHQGEWGIAMDNLQRLIQKLTSDTKCHFVMTAHPEREKNEITGAVDIMVSTLGTKLAPKIPRFFSDAIYLERKGKEFSWSTTKMGAQLKARNLEFDQNLPTTFIPLLENWKSKLQIA